MQQPIVFYWAGLFFLFDMNFAFAKCMERPSSSPIINPSCSKLTILPVNESVQALWGAPAPDFRLALGLWSLHTTDNDQRNNQNDGLGFSYKGYVVGTFVNSYYKRSYIIGIQRYWLMQPLNDNINYELGYRLGLVSGYAGHSVTGFKDLKNARVIPFVQFIFGLNYKHVGLEISAPNHSVISAGFYIRF